jgi:hypothetical protein
VKRDWKPGDLRATHLARVVEHITLTDRGHDSPCWVTDYYRDRGGYVSLRHAGKMRKLHRLTYEAVVGSIPEGRQLDHLCRVRECCNPAHLEPVTPRVNSLRGVGPTAENAFKTHCVNGHEFTPENTRIRTNGNRRCVTCQRAARMAHYYRNRESA